MKPLRTLGMGLAVLLAAGCDGGIEGDSDVAKTRPALSWRDPQAPVEPPASQPTGPAFEARAADERWYAEGRGRDQYNHPEYLVLTAPLVAATVATGDTGIAHDPYRMGWAETRGTVQEVAFANRYGAVLKGRLFGPRPLPSGPTPTVLFMPGRFAPQANSPFTGFANYENLLQSLAESGYVVLAVGPQGQDGSEYFSPPHPMCEPGGEWTQPQDFGLREPGACAGQEGAFAGYTGEYAALYQGAYDATNGDERPSAFLQGRAELEAALEQRAEGYSEFETRFVFAALDGADFLLSKDNPWRALIDDKRVAIVGHSAGGHAALVAGNGDRKRRFAAAVALDSYGFPPDTIAPSTPTLIQMAERQNEFGPYDAPPPNHLWPTYRVYRRFVAEEQPAMLVSLRGSTHHEWSYVPHALTNPASPVQNESSMGGQVGLYYTLAWLDYWLKPESRDTARARLLARTFDDSVDGSSIGTGTWDALTQANAPYRIATEAAADHLSVLFRTEAHFDGVACDDVQAGCP
jgi:hypothetical protein